MATTPDRLPPVSGPTPNLDSSSNRVSFSRLRKAFMAALSTCLSVGSKGGLEMRFWVAGGFAGGVGVDGFAVVEGLGR